MYQLNSPFSPVSGPLPVKEKYESKRNFNKFTRYNFNPIFVSGLYFGSHLFGLFPLDPDQKGTGLGQKP